MKRIFLFFSISVCSSLYASWPIQELHVRDLYADGEQLARLERSLGGTSSIEIQGPRFQFVAVSFVESQGSYKCTFCVSYYHANDWLGLRFTDTEKDRWAQSPDRIDQQRSGEISSLVNLVATAELHNTPWHQRSSTRAANKTEGTQNIATKLAIWNFVDLSLPTGEKGALVDLVKAYFKANSPDDLLTVYRKDQHRD